MLCKNFYGVLYFYEDLRFGNGLVVEFCPKIVTANQIASLCAQQYLLN